MKKWCLFLGLQLSAVNVAFADFSETGDWQVNGQAVIGATLTVQGNALSVGSNIININAGGNMAFGRAAEASDNPVNLYQSENARINIQDSVTGYGAGKGFSIGLGYSPESAYLNMIENYPLIFGTNNIERMRISADGNVGIGTTNPLSQLHIAGANAIIISSSTDNSIAHNGISFYSSPNGYAGDISGANNDLYFRSGTGAIVFRINGSKLRMVGNNIDLGGGWISGDGNGAYGLTVDSNKNTIMSGGNVGIGTISPAEKLEVSGNIKLSGASPSYKLTNLATPTNSSDAATKGYVDSAAAGVAPTGSVLAYGGSSAPSGWLECNGAAVSRTTYSALFSAIGTSFGSGDGSTTFNLPDLRGYFVRGWDHGAGHDPDSASRTALNSGGATGDNVGSYQADEFHSHAHGYNTPSSGSGSQGVVSGSSGYAQTETSGGNETRPKNVDLMHIIKY